MAVVETMDNKTKEPRQKLNMVRWWEVGQFDFVLLYDNKQTRK